jgi:hypothetical protein
VRSSQISAHALCLYPTHENGTVISGPADAVTEAELTRLWDRYWSFAPNRWHPEAAKAIERPDYHCEAFRAAWPNYLKWRDEEHRPALIAAATTANPWRIVDQVYYCDRQVFEHHLWSGRDIPIPGADPLTFRKSADFYVDKNHVWRRRLPANSPPGSAPPKRPGSTCPSKGPLVRTSAISTTA